MDLEMLIELENLKREINGQLLILAAAEGNIAEVNRLLLCGIDPGFVNKDGDNALIYAVRLKHLPVILALAAAGFDLEFADSNGNTPLIHAVELDFQKLGYELLRRKVKLETKNKAGHNALFVALSKLHTHLAIKLVEAGADFDVVIENNLTPFLLAIHNDYAVTIGHFIDIKPEKLDQKDHKGDTPIMAALKFDSIKVFKKLIELGANLEITDRFGETPLMLAVKTNRLEFAKVLLENKASIESINKDVKLIDMATSDEMRELIKKVALTKTFRGRLKASRFKGEIPEHLLCPIDLDLFNDPVTVNCGHTFNRESLNQLFYKPDAPKLSKVEDCPCCRSPIPVTELKNKTTIFIKERVEEFVEEQEQIHSRKKRVRIRKNTFFEIEPDNPATLNLPAPTATW